MIPIVKMLRQKHICLNLGVMVAISLTVGINYYLITFLAVTFDHPYMQVLFSTLAEIAAYATSGCLLSKLGVKLSLALTLAISALGGVSIMAADYSQNQESALFVCFVMVCKFGISGTYNIQLCSLAEVFPTSFIATGFGVTHFFSILFSICTPFMATIKEPIPIVVFSILSTLAAIISLFIKPIRVEKGAKEEASKDMPPKAKGSLCSIGDHSSLDESS